MTTEAVKWILESPEPAARWIVHAHLLGGREHARLAQLEQRAVLADSATQALIARLPVWETPADFSGHQSPGFAPNLLGLLADMGVAGGDDDRIEQLLDLDDDAADVDITALRSSKGGTGTVRPPKLQLRTRRSG